MTVLGACLPVESPLLCVHELLRAGIAGGGAAGVLDGANSDLAQQLIHNPRGLLEWLHRRMQRMPEAPVDKLADALVKLRLLDLEVPESEHAVVGCCAVPGQAFHGCVGSVDQLEKRVQPPQGRALYRDFSHLLLIKS